MITRLWVTRNLSLISRRSSTFSENKHTILKENIQTQLFPEIIQPQNPHFLKVAILGEPNVGKSSLINTLMPRSVLATSRVIHTTHKKSTGVITEGNVQIAFLDTPGIVSVREGRKLRLKSTVLSDPLSSILEADLVLVLFDIANKDKAMSLHPIIVRHLRKHELPAILVINKLDLIKYQRNIPKYAESVIQSYRTVSLSKMSEEEKMEHNPETLRNRFEAVFYTSSLTGDGVLPLKSYLLSAAKPGPWHFPADTTNDQDVLDVISDFIRAQLISHFHEEVPHVVVQQNEQLEIREDESLLIRQKILCPYGRVISKMLVSEGKVLQSVRNRATKELSAVFGREVELHIELKVEKSIRIK